ncbi:MAG: hypothetical protein GY708_08000 [Actinomycetia bacterium]|nr:hypothetical protein [Actinomycetes bacterium]
MCCPGASRVGGDAGEEHLSGLHLHEEQDVVAAQGGRVDGEEVGRDCGLGAQELGPGDIGSVWGRVDSVVGEDLPDRGLAGRVAESGEFALDAAVCPQVGLSVASHDQVAQLCAGWWPAAALLGWLGPVAGDTASVPAKQCFGCDQPALATRAGECHGDAAEQGSVVVCDGWSFDLVA